MTAPSRRGIPACTDAVIVVLGIIGSELVDHEGRVV